MLRWRLTLLVVMICVVCCCQDVQHWQQIIDLRERQVRGEVLTARESEALAKALEALNEQRNSPMATRLALAGLMEGDGVGEVFRAAPVSISESVAPVIALRATAADGLPIEGSYRKPPGAGPFPAVVIVHGGLDSQPAAKRQWALLQGPVHTRLLGRGYVVVQATFRGYDRKNLLAEGPLMDVEALFEAVSALPFVDRSSVAVYGGSGGGSLALDLATRRRPACVIVGEPATILFAGMLRTGEYGPRLAMMGDPHSYFGAQNRALLDAKLRKIRAPLLVFHGDIHPLKFMNHEIFLPAVKAAGIEHVVKVYPGEGHGFYLGSATSPETVEQVLQDADVFLRSHLKVRPVVWEP